MTITIAKTGTAASDVTGRLSERAGIRLRQESRPSNRDRFLDDIKLEMANHDGYFTDLFLGGTPTERWFISISEGARAIFAGEVKNNTVRFSPSTDWVSFDVFSLEKTFLKIAKKTKILPTLRTGEADVVFTTVQAILEREILQAIRTSRAFAGLVLGIDAGAFATDRVRFSASTIYRGRIASNITYGIDYVQELGANFTTAGLTTATAAGHKVTAFYVSGSGAPIPVTGIVVSVDDTAKRIYVDQWKAPPYPSLTPTTHTTFSIAVAASIGLEGRFTMLDRDTTVADLVLAIAGEKNAEFYIDPETRFFTLRPRSQITNDRAVTESLSLDSVLLQTPKPEVLLVEDERYDYVRLAIGEPLPPTPIFLRFDDAGLNGPLGAGTIYYAVTLFFDNGYESIAGEPLAVRLEFSMPTGRSPYLFIPGSDIPGVVARRLYRSDTNDGENKLRFLQQFDSVGDVYTTDTVQFIYQPNDPYLIANTHYPPSDIRPVGMWIRFDPDTGLWDAPIIDAVDGVLAPEGEILEDPVPALKFMDANDRSRAVENNPYHMVKFFGSEVYTEAHRDRWKPYFIKRGGMKVPLRGIGYRVGDSILAGHKLPSGSAASDKLVIRSAECDLIKDFSMARLSTT